MKVEIVDQQKNLKILGDSIVTKGEVYPFNPHVLVEYVWDKETNKVGVRKVHPYRLKDIYMHYLEHLNDNFDDDLLSDALDLIGCL